jgi:MinD-like ATPase involved in chromosome partitioning or flagellar assembly
VSAQSQLDSMRDFLGRRAAVGGRATPLGARHGHVVAIGAGKGGVGTSTVAALLAAAMAGESCRVLLVEAGERFGALHLVFGVDPMEPSGARHREPEARLLDVAPGLTLFPAASPTDETIRSSAERRLLFRRVVGLYDEFDLVVVDAGSTLETMAAVCAEGVGRFFAITAGDRISVVATYALIKALRARDVSVGIEVLANRLDDDSAVRAFEHVKAATDHFLGGDLTFAGVVPDDPDFASALAAGLGAHTAAEGSAAAGALREIGERVLQQQSSRGRPVGSPAASVASLRVHSKG